MKLFKLLAALLSCATLPVAVQAAPDFPARDKQLRIVVPFAAGGGVDAAARLLGTQLQKQLGVPVIVENRAGASGTLGGQAVRSAAPDGYTLLFSAATHVLAKQVLSNAPYDPLTDFAPIARVGEAPLLLAIAPQLPQKNLSEVLAAARQQPEKWTAAIPAAGAPSHLGTLLLAKQANVKLLYVPYKGTQPALTDLGGGHVQLLMDSMISMMPLAKAGRIKAIAISSAKRSALVPEVPTAQESGAPGFTYASWYGVWAPKDTPPDRVKTLHNAINSAVAALAKSGSFATLGIEPVSEDIDQFKRFSAAYVTQSTELLKDVGFKPE